MISSIFLIIRKLKNITKLKNIFFLLWTKINFINLKTKNQSDVVLYIIIIIIITITIVYNDKQLAVINHFRLFLKPLTTLP
jgi:hypothetical protein